MADSVDELVNDALAETTGWGIAAALLILILAVPVALLVGWTVRYLLDLVPGISTGVAKLIGRLGQVLVVLVAVAGALAALDAGPGLVALIVILGAIIGAAVSQTVVENVAAGLALPYLAGDQIESHGYEGTVADITYRKTVIETLDRRKVYIPNTQVMENPIIVYSDFEERRSEIELGIDYRTDIDAVSELLVNAISQVEGVHSDPSPYARPNGFGDGMYELKLRWWHDSDIETGNRIMGEVYRIVKRTLDDAGMPIPPPAAIFLSEHP